MAGKKKTNSSAFERRRLRLQQMLFGVLAVIIILSMLVSLISYT